MEQTRELFKTRLGFILIAAGCAVGIGNVWRFPFIAGQYGGACFVLVYLFFLLTLGIPLLTVELAVGRASRKSIAMCYETLEQKGSHWHVNKWWQLAGNYILMSFYGIITGWMLYYFFLFMSDSIPKNMPKQMAIDNFTSLLSNPAALFSCMVAVVCFAFMIVSLGVVKGVEKYTKPLMIILIALLVFMAARSCTLDGFSKGVEFYLKPDFEKFSENIYEAIWAAMGQAFFTLSTGMGGIAIFGSYMSNRHSLLNEALFIAALDTIVAILAGFVIFPACFTYDIQPDAGPNLLFVTMTSVFSNMSLGSFWGGLFFLFMLIAAVSTLIAVFENIIAASLELFNIKRKTAVLYNFFVILALSVLPVLGFNVLSDVHLIGSNTNITDFCDFLISNNILPIGSLVLVLFVTSKSGMGWLSYINECNTGKGARVSSKLRIYYRYILTSVIAVLLLIGYYTVFTRS
ncbi:MAG: sodium-dependent transporter [Succinivibrio sp.]|uniref:sodium-dependent transporter n=1 Tax=Succinivibrio sp. TaxID=2053619 RepID=UPI002F9443CC